MTNRGILIKRARVAMISGVAAIALLGPLSLSAQAAVEPQEARESSPGDALARYQTDPLFAERVDEVVARFASGVATQADRLWVASYPEISRGIVDASQTTVSSVERPLSAPRQAFGASGLNWTQCKSVDRYSNWYSVPPRKLVYRYHSRADFCYDGNRVVSVSNHYGYFSNLDPIYNVVNANVVNSVNGSGSSRVLHTQGHIQACIAVKIGCAFNFYPWGKVTLAGSGATSLAWGE